MYVFADVVLVVGKTTSLSFYLAPWIFYQIREAACGVNSFKRKPRKSIMFTVIRGLQGDVVIPS
jgi:hypothetical protein